MVDYGLEISPQPTAGRIQVGESRSSICRKLQAVDSVVTKMAAMHLFYATGNVTCIVTGEWYSSLLKQSVILALQTRWCDATTMFMQDGASPYIARSVNQLLRRHFFDDRNISRQFLTAWNPRPLDLNLCETWQWGYFEAMVYRDLIISLSDLKDSIERPVHNIPQFMLL